MLESLYPLEFVERRHRYALLVGICFSIIALGISIIIFPADPSLISIGIIVLLLYPTLQKLLLEHEKIEASRQHKGLFAFFSEHKNAFIFYLIITLSIFVVFFVFSFMFPTNTGVLFQQQANVVNLDVSVGQAQSVQGTIISYMAHNSQVLILMFLAAFILGEGGMLLLAWNASSWGVFFGATLATAFGATAKSLTILIAVLPHVIVELAAYSIIAIAASILSKALFSVHIKPSMRNRVVEDTVKSVLVAFIVLAAAAVVETIAFSVVSSLW